MSLKFSDRPQLNYRSPSPVDKVIARIPRGAQPMGSAPMAGTTPVQVIEADGTAAWCLYHRDGWRKLAPDRDSKTGAVQWRMNGETVGQPIAWLPRQR
jgi:hypothetical protein